MECPNCNNKISIKNKLIPYLVEADDFIKKIQRDLGLGLLSNYKMELNKFV